MPFQMYFKVYFSQLLNVISRFFYSCDFQNNYKSIPINSNIIFETKKKTIKELSKCFSTFEE